MSDLTKTIKEFKQISDQAKLNYVDFMRQIDDMVYVIKEGEKGISFLNTQMQFMMSMTQMIFQTQAALELSAEIVTVMAEKYNINVSEYDEIQNRMNEEVSNKSNEEKAERLRDLNEGGDIEGVLNICAETISELWDPAERVIDLTLGYIKQSGVDNVSQ